MRVGRTYSYVIVSLCFFRDSSARGTAQGDAKEGGTPVWKHAALVFIRAAYDADNEDAHMQAMPHTFDRLSSFYLSHA